MNIFYLLTDDADSSELSGDAVCYKQAAPHVMAALYQAAKVRKGKGMGIHVANRQHPTSWQPYTRQQR